MSAHCAICLEPARNALAALTCGHVYHKQCIDTWTNTNPSCPQCKRALRKQSRATETVVCVDLYFEAEEEEPDLVVLDGDGEEDASSSEACKAMRRQLRLSQSTIATVKSRLKIVEDERDKIACGKLNAEDRADEAVHLQRALQRKLNTQSDQVKMARVLESKLLATRASETEARAELLSTKSALNLTEGDRWQDIQPLQLLDPSFNCEPEHNIHHLLFNAQVLQKTLRKETAEHEAAQQEVQDLDQSVDQLRTDNRKYMATIKRLRTKEEEQRHALELMERDMVELEKARLENNSPPTSSRKRLRLSADDTDGGMVRLDDPSPRRFGAGAKPTYTPYGLAVTSTNLPKAYGVPAAVPTGMQKKATFMKAKPGRPGMGNKRAGSAGSRGLYASAGHKTTTVSTSITNATKGFNGMGGSKIVYKRKVHHRPG